MLIYKRMSHGTIHTLMNTQIDNVERLNSMPTASCSLDEGLFMQLTIIIWCVPSVRERERERERESYYL